MSSYTWTNDQTHSLVYFPPSLYRTFLIGYHVFKNLGTALREGLKKSAEFSALFKTHPPHSQSAEKNKKKHGLKIIKQK